VNQGYVLVSEIPFQPGIYRTERLRGRHPKRCRPFIRKSGKAEVAGKAKA